MKKILLFSAVVCGVAVLVVWFYPRRPDRLTLKLYAGAGLRPAVEDLVAAFEEESGIRVEPDYGGSGLILSRAREDRQADLFLPGDAWYVERLQKLSDKVRERGTVAYFVPVIVVAKGNPKHVAGLADLSRPDLRVGLGKAETCQIGRVSARILSAAGIDVAARNRQESLTVNELGVWVKMKTVDAVIVWDAIAASIADDVEVIPIPPAQTVVSDVVLAVLSTSRHPTDAARFLAFVKSAKGQRILKSAGYQTKPPARGAN